MNRFCQVNQLSAIDFCIDIGKETETPTTDRIVFSGHFKNNQGWIAVGKGTFMHDAFMLLFYPNVTANSLTVSIRTTESHNPPRLSKLQKNIHILSNNIQPDGYFQVELQCADCSKATSLNAAPSIKSVEDWIWSANGHQPSQSDDLDLDLQMHTAYGYFHTATVAIPITAQQLLGFNGTRATKLGATSSIPPVFDSHSLVKIHGFGMLAAFTFLFALGILAIRNGKRYAFVGHVFIQGFTSICVFLSGIAAILSQPRSSVEVNIHKCIGFLVLLLLVAQCLLGTAHHIKFLKTSKRTVYSSVHRFLGYFVVFTAICNASIGLMLQNPSLSLLTMILISVLVTLGWALLDYTARSLLRPSSQPYQTLSGSEPGTDEDKGLLNNED